MEPNEKKAFEPSGLVPRSIVRTFERFRQQLLPGSETAAIREYRISRYQVLVSARCLFTLLTIPIATNWLVSNWLLAPLIEHFWNTQQNELFLNSYQEERAFAELESFSEKLFFESLLDNEVSYDDTNGFENITLNTSFGCEASPARSQNTCPNNFTNQKHRYSPFQYGSKSIPHNCNNQFALFSETDTTNFPPLSSFITTRYIEDIHNLNSVPSRYGTQSNEVNNLLEGIISKHEVTQASLHTPYLVFCSAPRYLRSSTIKSEIDEIDPEVYFQAENSKNFWINSGDTTQTHRVPNLQGGNSSLKTKEKVQEKILELAVYYNQQTILSITNIIGDLVSLITLACLFVWMKPEITILKSFLIEAIYSLSYTTKSFLLILLTDLLVGFHSPRGWETALELLLKHLGLPENQDFVFLFVATFPVLLDTVFKYWIFRHLNKISPSTVATYHSMIE